MDMVLVSTFNDRFSEALNDIPLTEFALTVGLSKQTISAYKNGKRKPKKPMLKILAQNLNVNPAWLLGYDVPKFMKYATGCSTAEVVIGNNGVGQRIISESCKELEIICLELNDEGLHKLIEHARLLLLDSTYKRGASDFEDVRKHA